MPYCLPVYRTTIMHNSTCEGEMQAFEMGTVKIKFEETRFIIVLWSVHV